MEIEWSRLALHQLDKALDYMIEQGFDTYAAKLEEKIISKTDGLIDGYRHHPIDKYKKNNDGTYRAFEIDDYRISYRVKGALIKIIRVRHTSRKPIKY